MCCKRAADRPKGYVGSAVMLNAKLKPGVNLLHVIAMTEALGEQISADGRRSRRSFRWTDGTQSHVTCEFRHGKLVKWDAVPPGRRGRRRTDARALKSRVRANPDPKDTKMSALPSMADRDGKIWMDGEMVEWRDAKIHVLTHTLHYGCGAFEGVRAYNTVERHGHLPAAGAHRSPVQQRQDPAHGPAVHQGAVNEAQRAVVRANKLESCYLRPLTWIGSQKLGVSPKGNTIHLMVAAWAWGAYLGEEGMKRGIRVKTSSYTRHHVNITMTQAKAVSNYTNSILANMEALDDGYDEALLLDSSGFVCEGAGENIFVIKNGVIYTPDLSAGALNGITRNTVFHICKDLGIEVVQKRITRDELYIADEAFFTGTAAEVTPIRELDGVEIGAGSRGPITERSRAPSSTS